MRPNSMDYKKIDSCMKLRKLELEAYSSIINAFRAQGNFNKEKKKILNDIRYFLSISLERHQAEIRRAINDEKLTKISFNINGEDFLEDWISEGRRLIPFLPRMIPKTGLSFVADTVAKYEFIKTKEYIKVIESEKERSFKKQIKENSMENISDIGLNKNEYYKDETNLYKNENSLILNKRKLSNSICSELNNQKTKVFISCTNNKNLQIKSVLSDMNNEQKLTPTSTCLATHTLTNYSQKFTRTNNDNLQSKVLIMSSNAFPNKSTTNPTIQTLRSNNQANYVQLNRSPKVYSASMIRSSQANSCSSLITSTTSSTNTVSTSLINSSKILNSNKLQQSPRLVVLPKNNQAKTLTIPISHNVKTLHLPSQNTTQTIVYQHPTATTNVSAATIKTIPGITIQAFKTPQGNRVSGNLILMPSKANNLQNNQSIGAKGLLRQINSKDFPIKVITSEQSTASLDETVLTEQTSKETSQKIILTNLNKDTNLSNNTPIRNIIKAHSIGTNIFKVMPKSATTSPSSVCNPVNVNKSPPKTATINQRAITIPSRTNAATFMEILKKNIPIKPYARTQTNTTNSEPSKSNSITQSTSTSSSSPSSSSITKTIKIPVGVSTETITKIIFSSVVTNTTSSATETNNKNILEISNLHKNEGVIKEIFEDLHSENVSNSLIESDIDNELLINEEDKKEI